ncbi:2968_t:CDS:2, partial [Scutellospora calospora]
YELSEFLSMIQPIDLFINRNNLLIISLHKDEVSTSSIYNNTNSTDIQEIDDISSAISNTSKEFKTIEQSSDSSLLSILNNSDSKNTFEFLLDQHKLHDAYCFKPLEQKFKLKTTSSTRIDKNSILPNNTSHLVVYFTKNENPE